MHSQHAVKLEEEKESISKEVSTPLTHELMKKILNEINNKTDMQLEEALIQSALNGEEFPELLHENIKDLQQAYKKLKRLSDVAIDIEAAIKRYIQKEGIDVFKKLLHPLLDNQFWKAGFLICLARKLNIPISEEPLVEATIQDGKVLWRIVVGANTVYDRYKERRHGEFNFSEKPCWRMSWYQFRKFKDAGKRTGTVRVTQERFARNFTDIYIPGQADTSKVEYYYSLGWQVWGYLFEWGILDNKYRLSQSWYPLTNVNFKLFLAENFSAYHQAIADALYHVTTNKEFGEKISLPDRVDPFFIYRPSRSRKKWHDDGLITNYEPKTTFLTQPWDVGTYQELKLHRCTEKKDEGNNIIYEYDHIPSKAQLKAKCKEIFRSHESKIQQLKEEEKLIDNEIHILNLSSIDITKLVTRSRSAIDPKIEELEKRREAIKKKKEDCSANIKKEVNVLSEHSWTICIPKTIHHAGATHGVSRKKQEENQNGEHPFLHNVITHVNNFNKDKLSFGEMLKALGAFRNMYRRMCKEPTPINGIHTISHVPCAFFKDRKDREKIDKYFNKQVAELICKM